MLEYTLYRDFSTGHFHLYEGTDLNRETRREVLSTYGFPSFLTSLNNHLGKQHEPVQVHYASQGETLWPKTPFEGQEQSMLESVLKLYNLLVQPPKSKKTSRKL